MMGYGRGQGPSGNKYYQQNNFAMNDAYGEEDDMDDYGGEGYYAEEDSDDYAGQNYPPGALFQGGQPAMGGIGAGGVPFYGQQQKMGAAGPMGYGGMSGGAFGGGAFGAPASSAGAGGFTYGMASNAGGLFGASGAPSTGLGGTQFGAPATAKPSNPGLFQFGKVSQMGGIGSMGGASTFGAGSSAGLFGAAPLENDPYANIAIDLNKVKKQEAPPKLHEHKTEEEKKKEATQKSTSNTKSNLKKEIEKKEDDKKKGVKFGKSTTYEIDCESEDGSTDGINKDHLKEGRGSPRPGDKDKKVIAEKDLSDGRSEKEKILEMLEKQQREQLEEIAQMNEWKEKATKDTSNKETTQVVSTVKDGKGIGDSNSYDSNDFEDGSMSNSGSKSKINYWPGKDQFKQKESVSVSQSKDESEGDKYDPSAMEAYLKKQQQQKAAGVMNKPNTLAAKSIAEVSESSNTYEEDFESLSKSQTALTTSMLQQPAGQQKNTGTFEYKPSSVIVPPFKSVADQYKKKENKAAQTDFPKYENMPAGEFLGQNNTMKEWTLNKNLQDAEGLIQEMKSKEAKLKDKITELELQMKRKEVEYHTQRREALNGQETSKRLQEQLKDAVHKINLYKIETEELIKQIDLADAKTRTKEDELRLVQAEYERKLKLQEERIMFRVSKQEEREVFEVKRMNQIKVEEMERKIEEQQEEIDYFNQKIAKIEVENKALRNDKQSQKRIKELEDEILNLKNTQVSSYQIQKENINLKNIKNELSKEDQVKLQRELQQLELMVRGYQEENEKAVTRIKQLERDNKIQSEKVYAEQRKTKDLHQKQLLNSEKVFVEENKEELDIQTVNKMGLGNAISQKELQDLHAQLQTLTQQKQDHDRDIALREGQLRAQIQKLRDEKSLIEKQLYDSEFLIGDKDREIQLLKDQHATIQSQNTLLISDLQDKISWFRSNQKLLSEEDEQTSHNTQELNQLREKCRKLEENNRRTRDLERKCKLLEETIKAKNPNSIPMLIQASKEAGEGEKQGNREDKQRIAQLEQQIADQDAIFDKKLRTLRQEQERLKQVYEQRQGGIGDSKRVQELESELDKTKTYYNKRIREIEDKYKFRIPEKETTKQPAASTKTLTSKPPQSSSKQAKEQPLISKPQSDDTTKFESQIEQLTKERNLLAQKVVNYEMQNNKRRQSFSGASLIPDESKHALNAIYSICNMLKQQKPSDSKEVSFQLIESALSCVEQLKTKDPQRNTLISKSLLQLTQELQQQSQISDKVINEIIAQCDVDQGKSLQMPDLKLKTQQSAHQPAMNKDLSGVVDDIKQSPISQKPKNVSHPFVVSETPNKQQRSVKDIIKTLVQSGLDFERIVSSRKLNPKRVQINQLYQIIREEEPSLKTITVDEIRQLQQFVKEKIGDEVEEIGRNDEIDVNNLANVLLDISLEVFGEFDNKNQQKENNQNTRYSQEPSFTQKSPVDDQRKQTPLQNQDQSLKIDRMQRVIQDLTQEKNLLLDRLEKLESSKNRVERILKQSIGNKVGTMRRTNNGQESNDNELFEELGVLMKRIEFLEQQSEDREKQSYQEHGPCKREITRLAQELDEERLNQQRMLSKKNAEVAYFKAELDALLSEMKSTINNKKAQRSIKF